MVQLPMLRPWTITGSTSSSNSVATTTAIATAEAQGSRQFGVPLSELCALGLVAEEYGVPKVVHRMVEHLRTHGNKGLGAGLGHAYRLPLFHTKKRRLY